MLTGLFGFWTLAVAGLTVIVLAKPRWFWQFVDPWSGTTVAPAELAWVESFHLRPVIVLVCGSLVLIFVGLANGRGEVEASSVPGSDAAVNRLGATPLLTSWLNVVTLAVTVACCVALGLIGWRPDWFFHPNLPSLAWLVTGGLALFALAGSLGWFGEGSRSRIILACVGYVLAGWLFLNVPNDEFGYPLSLQNRIVYLVPGLVLFSFNASAVVLQRRKLPAQEALSALLGLLIALLAVTVFVRANYLQPQSGVVRAVLGVDVNDGRVVWQTPVYVAAAEKKHSLNSLATPTPACDGERVYAYFGSGLAALDTNGRLLWLNRDADYSGFIRYGAGSSVALADDKILIYRDSEFIGHGDHLDDNIKSQPARRASKLIALDKRTGAEVWSIAPPFSHDSYMTPLVWTRGERREVVLATWKTLAGFALSDGALRWTHAYPMQQVVPSPAVNGDCLFVTGGNAVPCPIVAVRAPGAAAPARTVWSNSKTGGNIVSPVCWNGLLFSTSHIGVLTCRDAETGTIHWSTRLDNRCLASLVAGGGKLYALDQEGTLQVLAADTNGSVLATHSFNEHCAATPALAANMIVARTAGHLYGVGSGK